jgi:hypothetical protein
MHTADTACPAVLCARCGELMHSPDEAEGCRDPACPLQEPAEILTINRLDQKPMKQTTHAPWGKR